MSLILGAGHIAHRPGFYVYLAEIGKSPLDHGCLPCRIIFNRLEIMDISLSIKAGWPLSISFLLSNFEVPDIDEALICLAQLMVKDDTFCSAQNVFRS